MRRKAITRARTNNGSKINTNKESESTITTFRFRLTRCDKPLVPNRAVSKPGRPLPAEHGGPNRPRGTQLSHLIWRGILRRLDLKEQEHHDATTEVCYRRGTGGPLEGRSPFWYGAACRRAGV
jgi:DMSO/TMAO reductase YedYZ molybdopterin-dependent catalytic subunit